MSVSRFSQGLAAALVSALVVAPLGLVSAPANGSVASVKAATLVSRADVDGDRRADAVYVQRYSDHLVTTVVTARGTRASRRLAAPSFGGWHGAARFDKRRGAELVFLTAAGAHTTFYKVLTWRGGKLKALKSPSRRGWVTDSAASFSIGWKRYVRKGRAYVRLTSLSRDTGPFTGRQTTWVRKGTKWKRTKDRRITVRNEKKAFRYAGWHVTGLKRF